MIGRLALAAVLAWTAVAFADPKTEAQEHLVKAADAHKQGRFADALNELMTAYALDPQPDLLYSIGQVHVKLGNCPQAITFYTRFLATKPDKDEAAIARVAIDTCKKAPPPVKDNPPPPPPPPIKDTPPPPPPTPVVSIRSEPRAWYSDPLGDTLLGAGVVGGIVGVIFYRNALNHRDAADTAMTYPEYAAEIDSAKSARTIGIVFGAAGGALIAASIVRYATRDSSHGEPVVTAAPGGGAVGWITRF